MFNPCTSAYIAGRPGLRSSGFWGVQSQIMEVKQNQHLGPWFPGHSLLLFLPLAQFHDVWAWHRRCHLDTPVYMSKPYSHQILLLWQVHPWGRGSSSPWRQEFWGLVQSSVGQGAQASLEPWPCRRLTVRGRAWPEEGTAEHGAQSEVFHCSGVGWCCPPVFLLLGKKKFI